MFECKILSGAYERAVRAREEAWDRLQREPFQGRAHHEKLALAYESACERVDRIVEAAQVRMMRGHGRWA